MAPIVIIPRRLVLRKLYYCSSSSSTRIVVKDRSVTPVWPRVVNLLHKTGQLAVCHYCHCGAGRSIGCSDDLDNASSCAREDGRESDQHDTGVLGVLVCLRKAWQCDRRQNSDGVFTTRCTSVQSAVLRSHVVRPSVRLWRWWIVIT